MAGMPENAAVFVDGSPVFDTLEGFKGTVLAQYAETGSPLLSGYLIGEKYPAGKGGRARRRARPGARRPAGLPAAVARPVVRHVPGRVQLGSLRQPGCDSGAITKGTACKSTPQRR